MFFFCTFEFDERDNQFFWIVSLHLFWKWKTYNCQRCTFWSSSFLKQGNIWICQYPLAKKEHLFSRIKGCFFIINVSQTKTLVFSSIMDELCWFKNNMQIYLQYIYIYMVIMETIQTTHLAKYFGYCILLMLPSYYHIYSYMYIHIYMQIYQ